MEHAITASAGDRHDPHAVARREKRIMAAEPGGAALLEHDGVRLQGRDDRGDVRRAVQPRDNDHVGRPVENRRDRVHQQSRHAADNDARRHHSLGYAESLI